MANVLVAPQCSHLKDKFCLWLSDAFGKPVIITPVYCNSACKNGGGPYCGRETTKPSVDQFLAKAFIRSFGAFDHKYIGRVLRHYRTECNVRVPPQWEGIKVALSPIFEFPFVKKILLTGSLILKDEGHKDYDVVIQVEDVGQPYTPDFKKALPTHIDGIRMDYFFILRPGTSFYSATLDCDEKILYTTSWFHLNLKTLQEGIRVVECKTHGIDALVEDYLRERYPGEFAMTFFETAHCKSQRHCTICRDKGGGAMWRKSVLKAFGGSDTPDFECPFGKQWGDKSASVTVQNRPVPTPGQVATFVQAVAFGKRVLDDTIQERLRTCSTCDYMRRTESGDTWCGACGCKISTNNVVDNLAAYEENLPKWGCKHPKRAEGLGWKT